MKSFLSFKNCLGLDAPKKTYGAIISRVTTWSDGQVLSASALNGEFNNILSDYNGNITNANLSASAAIAYSKLNLTGNITNADISAGAAIAVSKLATGLSGSLVGTSDSQTLTNKTINYSNNTITNLPGGTQSNGVSAQNQSQSVTTVDASTTDVSGATITLTTTAKPCLVIGYIAFSLTVTSTYGVCYLNLDGSTVIYGYGNVGGSNGLTSIPIMYYSTPSAAAHTWKLQAAVGSGAQTMSIKSYSLNVIELK